MDQQDSSTGSIAVSAKSQPPRSSLARLARTIYSLWIRYGIYALTIIFTAIFFIFLVNKHNAFNTRTYDFARFSQAIWNSLHGQVLFTSIDSRSILGNHFSPYMALLSPLFLLLPNERVLFLMQAVSVAVAGLILALMMRNRHRALAPWFLLAFFLNPAIHQLALFEFRRVVLALPFLALALYALSENRRWLMLGALLVALLAKEDIGLFVFGVGLFLIIFQRDWKWGLGMMLLGLAWSLVVSFWVIPAFRTPGTEYPQLFYFEYLGSSYGQIIGTLRQDPLILLRTLLGVDRLAALWRILLPLGLFLPFFGADWLLIAIPSLFMLLISGDAEMFGLQKWYPATFLPVFFAATAVGIGRFQISKARWLLAWLVVASAVGYWLYSPLPGGQAYNPHEIEVTEHDRLGLAMVQELPEGASVATQPHYAPHLTLRKDLYHYPWIKIGAQNIDYFLFDKLSSAYPFTDEEMASEIGTFLADPDMKLAAEVDGIFLFQQGETGTPNFLIPAAIEDSIKLEGFNFALLDEMGIYRLQDQLPLAIKAGDTVRIDLYWQALDAPDAERTVSLRMVNDSGWLFAQHDGMPASGSRPTSWWKPKQRIRDVHYLTLAPDTPPGTLDLELVLYDSFSQDIIPWPDGEGALRLAAVEVQP